MGANMFRKRIWQLLLSLIMTASLGFVLFSKSMGSCPEANKESLICILIAFSILAIVPGLLILTKSKGRLSVLISSMLFSGFQITFWINLGFIIIPVSNVMTRIFINIGILIICISCVIVNIRYELKPKSGLADKKEKANINRALSELELAASILPEINDREMATIRENMHSFINGDSHIVHGMDANILNECRAIRNSALCKDTDLVEYHTSFLEQLIVLAKQKN